MPVSAINRPLPSTLDNSKVQQFVQDMQAGAVFTPIEVAWVQDNWDNYYFAFGGCHRWAAVKQLGLPTIRARLIRDGMAAQHLQKQGLDEADAQRLATAFSEKLSPPLTEPAAIDDFLAKFAALKTPLALTDWCACFVRCAELLSLAPATVQHHLEKLSDVMGVGGEALVAALLKTPSLLLHDPADIGEKVAALQAVMALPEDKASVELIIERFSRYPAILARSVDALEAQLSGLAGLLGCDIQRAARLAFKVPALAAASNEELSQHMALLEQLLGIEQEAVRGLVLRQPSLLARTSEGLSGKVEAYAELFGADAVGKALAGAPQLLTMKVDAVKVRHELLASLAALQPAWTAQLGEASKETLAVWLCSSEKKLRRLEVANGSPRLARLPLFRLLSHSEGRWADEVARAGGAAGAAADEGEEGADDAGEHQGTGSRQKRARGGRRERERKEKAAARAAAAAERSEQPRSSAAPAASAAGSAPAAAPAAAAAGGGDAAGKPKRPRGGRRERERRERIARREAAGKDGGEGDEQHGDDFGADYEPRATAAAGKAASTEQAASGNGVGGGASAERPRRSRGGRREREKRERREARAGAAGGAAGGSAAAAADDEDVEDGAAGASAGDGSGSGRDFGAGFGPGGEGAADGDGDCGTHSGDGSGEGGGQRPKRATRGGRREREKRERLAARLAAATATAAAAAALDA
ncbi:hypothetical protein OEZ85_011523 [Tetradesmus obliquus]|uniref:sulfiredoxin n=1 Tax=Tetradesmus obliquus TaxID=3088 RepID=A0ABY8TQY7_TETOB|nr:hypothetical protein OEZ85_011523 [Tetradesmus obliquus]